MFTKYCATEFRKEFLYSAWRLWGIFRENSLGENDLLTGPHLCLISEGNYVNDCVQFWIFMNSCLLMHKYSFLMAMGSIEIKFSIEIYNGMHEISL